MLQHRFLVYGKGFKRFQKKIAQIFIVAFCNGIYFFFGFMGKGIAQVGKHYFPTVAQNFVEYKIQTVGYFIEYAKRQNGNQVDERKRYIIDNGRHNNGLDGAKDRGL